VERSLQMANGRQSEEVKSDSEVGRLVLRKNARLFVEHLSAIEEGITKERVHAIRVQSRRLRAALDTFRDLLAPRLFRSAYRSVRQITRLFGRPREVSVSCALLRQLAGVPSKTIADDCAAILSKANKRAKKQEKGLKKALEKIDPLRISSRLELLISAIEPNYQPSPKSTGISKPPPTQLTLFPWNDSILKRAKETLLRVSLPISRFCTSEFPLAADEELHRLRIAAKKTRYAMELFEPYWPGELAQAIMRARALQDAGGNYHDWCVLSDYLAGKVKSRKAHCKARALLLMSAEKKKEELRREILPALTRLQQILPLLSAEGHSLQSPAMILARGGVKIRAMSRRGRRISTG
jgi:CHAD domain-containing protein